MILMIESTKRQKKGSSKGSNRCLGFYQKGKKLGEKSEAQCGSTDFTSFLSCRPKGIPTRHTRFSIQIKSTNY